MAYCFFISSFDLLDILGPAQLLLETQTHICQQQCIVLPLKCRKTQGSTGEYSHLHILFLQLFYQLCSQDERENIRNLNGPSPLPSGQHLEKQGQWQFGVCHLAPALVCSKSSAHYQYIDCPQNNPTWTLPAHLHTPKAQDWPGFTTGWQGGLQLCFICHLKA